MDAELALFLANESRKRIPVARVGVSTAQLVTESETDIDIAQIEADQGSSIATVTTIGTHGIVAGEVMTIAGNDTQATIDTINGNGTIAVVSCSTPHALIDGETVTITGNAVNLSNASVTGDGSTATVVTAIPHGFADGDAVTANYTVAGAESDITVGILSVSGDGTTTTVTTTSPHTFIAGEVITIAGESTSNTIVNIIANDPVLGESTVFSASTPPTGSMVTIAGAQNTLGIVTPIVTSGGTATVVADGTLPGTMTPSAIFAITGLNVSGSLTTISATGTTFFGYTATDHGLGVGSFINISGISGPTSHTQFNGAWVVYSVPDSTTFACYTTFSASVTFSTSASWNGDSGFNGIWTVASTSGDSIHFSTSVIARTGHEPTYTSGAQIYQPSDVNGTYTVVMSTGTYFVINGVPSATQVFGGSWAGPSPINGSQTITTIDSSIQFEFTSTYDDTGTGGYATGACGLNSSGATISFQDANTFTYPTSADTGGIAIAGFSISGDSGFNGSQSPITYIDGLTFSYDSGTVAIISGGNISAPSGYNMSPAQVLTVLSPTTFTIPNQLAGALGTALPYVYGATSATGTVTTYDTSYVGVTTSQLTWSQPAVFSTNGMVSGSRGITVPKNGWYKIIGRMTLSASPTSTYANIAIGAYAWMDIYIDDYLQARGTRINQQQSGEYSLIVSDLTFVEMNQTINAIVTAFTPLNSGEIYAWGFDGPGLTYLAAVFVSP